MKVLLLCTMVLLLGTSGCATQPKSDPNYQAYLASCQDHKPYFSGYDSGGRPVTLYQPGCAGVTPPPRPQNHGLAWASAIMRYGVMGLLGWKLFDEGVALGVGSGIGALGHTDSFNQTAPPPETVIVEQPAPIIIQP